MFCGVRQEQETCVKYETSSWSNTDANVKYWGPIPKLVYLQNCVQTTECNTFPLLIPWIPDKTHPKEKNYQDMHVNVIPTKCKQLPWWHLHWTLYWAMGFHMTSLKFKLQNYWFSWDFIFMMHKSCWQQLTTTYITSWWEKKMNLQWYIKGKLKTRSCNVKVGASVRVWRKYWSEYALLYNRGGVASLS